MQHESFSSPEVAAILNTSFIPIKVDREERPDVDEIYMNYVNATTGSGGWPLNVFLTPDLDPVFGGTYWPSPGSSPLQRISNNSEDTHSQPQSKATEPPTSTPEPLDLDLLDDALTHFISRYDPINSGFSTPS